MTLVTVAPRLASHQPLSQALDCHRPPSRQTANLVRPHTTNVAAQRSVGPPIAVLTGRTIAATTSIQTHQSRRRDQIPIVLAAPPHIPHRDFVPWRFSVAGRFSAPILSSCRRPKTCTGRDIATGDYA